MRSTAARGNGVSSRLHVSSSSSTSSRNTHSISSSSNNTRRSLVSACDSSTLCSRYICPPLACRAAASVSHGWRLRRPALLQSSASQHHHRLFSRRALATTSGAVPTQRFYSISSLTGDGDGATAGSTTARGPTATRASAAGGIVDRAAPTSPSFSVFPQDAPATGAYDVEVFLARHRHVNASVPADVAAVRDFLDALMLGGVAALRAGLVADCCRLARRAGLHARGCELMLAAAPSALAQMCAADALPTDVLVSAWCIGNTAVLRHVLRVAALDRENSSGGGALVAAQVYATAATMLAKQPHASDTRAELAAIASTASVVMGVSAREQAHFLEHSVRLALYTHAAFHSGADAERQHQRQYARVLAQVLRYWARRSPSAISSGCLSMMMQQFLRAGLSDAAEFALLYIDIFLRRRLADPASLMRGEQRLVALTLRYFAFTRQAQRGVRWLSTLRMLFPRYLPDVSTATAAARLAASARHAELAGWCLDVCLNDRQPSPPAPADLLGCLLSAARAGLRNLAEVTETLISNGLVNPSREELLLLTLLHGRHTMRPVAALSEALTVAGEAPELLSARVMTAALRTLQGSEADGFLLYYVRFAQLLRRRGDEDAARRSRWLSLALQWLVLRRPRLDHAAVAAGVTDGIRFVANEAREVLRPPPSAIQASAGLPRRTLRLLQQVAVMYPSIFTVKVTGPLCLPDPEVLFDAFIKQRHLLSTSAVVSNSSL